VKRLADRCEKQFELPEPLNLDQLKPQELRLLSYNFAVLHYVYGRAVHTRNPARFLCRTLQGSTDGS